MEKVFFIFAFQILWTFLLTPEQGTYPSLLYDLQVGATHTRCPSDEFCMAIPTRENSTVQKKCIEVERGNLKSEKVCLLAYIKDPDLNENDVEQNPNEDRCKLSSDARVVKACSTLGNTYYPFIGYVKNKLYTHCLKHTTPYVCTVGGRKYVTCTVASFKCQNPCTPQ